MSKKINGNHRKYLKMNENHENHMEINQTRWHSMKFNEKHNNIIKYRPWTSVRMTVFKWARRARHLNTVIPPEAP